MQPSKLTIEMMAASILALLGDEVFGNLQGAAPSEAEKKAHEKRILRRRTRLENRRNEKGKSLSGNDRGARQVGPGVYDRDGESLC
jgi:ABC-type branched-subunit amino acid transport system ATPase component